MRWWRLALALLALLWLIPFVLLTRAPPSSAPPAAQPAPSPPPPPPPPRPTPLQRTQTPSPPPTSPAPLPPSLPVRPLGPLPTMRSPALLVICYNRPDYLADTLTSLARLPGVERYPVYVSQDGDHAGVAEVVRRFALLFPHYNFWQRHPRTPAWPEQSAAAWLAQHFRYALERVLVERNHSHVIILEDDMLFAADFLALFEATAPLLERDPTLWCVSSWNDNGFTHLSLNASRLFRAGYFPGLGWMMRRELWLEIRERWPLQHWDHWMRANARGRDCVAPEVSRTKNIGAVGAHMNREMYAKFVENVAFHSGPPVDWGPLDYLLRDNYARQVRALVAAAHVVPDQRWPPWSGLSAQEAREKSAFLVLYTKDTFRPLANAAKVWPAPRAHFDHVLILRTVEGHTVLLADSRASSMLPPALRYVPPPTLRHVAAPTAGQPCHTACAALGMRCDQAHFEYVNSCEALAATFSCINCNVENGADIPCRVEQAGHPNFHFCLIADHFDKFSCDGSWPGSRRLCPCV